jgi:hypothetical protein
VDEYLSDDVDSNSEDEKRIWTAENSAVKKLKTSKTSKRPNDKSDTNVIKNVRIELEL